MKRVRRTASVMLGFGFAAAPALMTLALLTSLINGFSASFFPFGFKVFTDAFVRHDTHGMALGAGLTGALIAFYWGAAVFDANVGVDLADRVTLFISTRIARLINAVPGLEHLERPDYLKELELIEWNRSLLSQGPRLSLMSMQMIVRGGTMIALLVSIHPALLALAAFGAVPAMAEGLSVKVRQRADERISERRRMADELFALAATAGPAKEVRIYGLSPELVERHDRLAEDVRHATVRAALIGGVVGAAGWTIFVAGFVAGVGLVLLQAIHGHATPGQVVMAVVIGQQVRLFFGQAAGTFGQFYTSAKTAGRLLWLEDFVGSADVVGEAEPPERIERGIDFSGVSFVYPGTEQEILASVELFIPAGKVVAIVGENGAGKTTLMKLLTRMYEPSSGVIAVDGQDVRRFDLSKWRGQTAATLQDFVQFELVASEVVGIGDLPRVEDAPAVEVALERANARDVVATLDQGLDTQLGPSFPGGRQLSGGQWQKLALGRGMMRDRPLVLILDEPTASLDAETEHQLFQRYAEAARRTASVSGAITILVSHRFSTVRAADMIIVLDQGRVVEFGSHRDLMAKSGLYAELFSLQAKAYQ